MEKQVKGQITVFAALSIMVVLSLVCTCIQSAAVAVQTAHAQAAALLSLESVFAGYSNTLFEEYGIFACRDLAMEAEFSDYFHENMQAQMGGNNVEAIAARITKKQHMTDTSGKFIRKGVLSYMKYKAGILALERIFDVQQGMKQSAAVSEITEEMISCETSAGDLDAHQLQVLSLVEGIKTQQQGIVTRQEIPVFSGDYFVKSFLGGDFSKEAAGISDDRIYEAAKRCEKYVNVKELLEQLQDCYEDTQDCEEEELIQLADACKELQEKIQRVLERTQTQTEKALKEMRQYEEKRELILQNINKCKTKVQEKKETLDYIIYTELVRDIDDMQTEQEQNRGALYNMEKMKAELEKRKLELEVFDSNFSKLPKTYDPADVEKVTNIIFMCQEKIDEMDNSKLIFDYSKMNFQAGEGTGNIKNIYQKMKNGVLGLVIDADAYSQKSISYTNLAIRDGVGQPDLTVQESSLEKVKNEMLYHTYLMEKFPNYTDYSMEDGTINKQSGKQLDYTLEYILYGKNNDKENLSSMVMELSLMREGMNLACLLTDVERKAQAEALAVTLVGFTGNMAAIKAAKYLILTVWAYGESVLDVKRLCTGQKVALVKTKENWQLSLKHLLEMQFTDEKKDEKGFTYKEYAGMALYLKKNVDIYYRTLAAMELRMIELGKTDFRMRDYVYECEANYAYRIHLIGYTGQKSAKYSYG